MGTTTAETNALMQLDRNILKAMKARPTGIMTYVIRNILTMEHGYRDLDTAKVLRRLKWMERAGDVERVSSSYATMLCWRAKAKDA